MVLKKLGQLLFTQYIVPRVKEKVRIKLTDRLADSFPIRGAAKITAYFYLHGKNAIEAYRHKSVPGIEAGKTKQKYSIVEVQNVKQKDLKDMMVNGESKFAKIFPSALQKQFEDTKQKLIEQRKRI